LTQNVTGWQRDLVLFLDRQIYRLTRRWLALFNLLTGLYVLLPILASVLMAFGAPQVAHIIYLVYRPACHQLPERSFFLFGPKPSYTLDELWALGLVSETDGPLARHRFVGATEVGYKMALCQRDIALYGALFVGGLLFGLIRKHLRPLSLLGYAVAMLPMAIDGATQLLLLRESNPVLRVLTGALLGMASVWLLYPRLEEAFLEVRVQANERVRME
jgi:uncharacterized membrane protein